MATTSKRHDLSDRQAETLAQGIEAASHLMDDLARDLNALVDKYNERVKSVSLLAVVWSSIQTEHANPSDYKPEVMRSRILGYINVLRAMTKPIEHDGAFWETMIHDALNALEMTDYFDRAMSAYRKNLDASHSTIR